ncbi:ALQxL family class IV lanthipeptide [Streptosporangium amethystogenes subsp. fukuiense]|uniref:ALQxL family class IV lanthipeptide n=1 Tax=Streptosporangium amethystogenes subsp. fukuiense TaxID=698418 RepID=A0ABW2TET9_9ACTN
MELDINALDLLPAQTVSALYPCEITCPPKGTCTVTCKVTSQ